MGRNRVFLRGCVWHVYLSTFASCCHLAILTITNLVTLLSLPFSISESSFWLKASLSLSFSLSSCPCKSIPPKFSKINCAPQPMHGSSEMGEYCFSERLPHLRDGELMQKGVCEVGSPSFISLIHSKLTKNGSSARESFNETKDLETCSVSSSCFFHDYHRALCCCVYKIRKIEMLHLSWYLEMKNPCLENIRQWHM